LAVFTFLVGQQTLLKVIQFDDPIIFAFFWTGFLIGYMTYDITHYSLHHVDTSKHTAGHFHSLQKYHNQHHFGGEEAGFGVSSPFWDVIFRTGYTKKMKI
jgi:sterol desaturase/sphingolipid hydroxylase (fatty acid hydroxylase superfamily)